MTASKHTRNLDMARMYLGGATLVEVGAAFGVSDVAVLKVLVRLGMPRRARGRRPNVVRDLMVCTYYRIGHTIRECSDMFSLSIPRVHQILGDNAEPRRHAHFEAGYRRVAGGR